MSDTIIKVENLSKKYVLSHQSQERYTALRDVIARGASNVGKKLLAPFTSRKSTLPATREEFYALKDVSFEIKQGDRVGIIGRNGAGKSTLLKVLSRITEPTNGRIEITGRAASLLEVGTGFHPELTGRENIFLNGAILGMGKAEIRRKFDEIVAFAEVEKFLDTPVKHYSSGMYVRLAFAVAAHLEPEILIVDEVLAVGDAQFQKKCLGKMEQVGREGRTVLFVSHNIQAIIRLCNKAIMLKGGKINRSGLSQEVSSYYLNDGDNLNSIRTWNNSENAPGNDDVRLSKVRVINLSEESRDVFYSTETIGIEMSYEVFSEENILWFGFNLFNSEGINIFDTHSVSSEFYNKKHPKGKYTATAWIPKNLFAEGLIIVGCAIFNHLEHKIYFHEKDVIAFSIIDPLDGSSATGKSPGNFPGILRPLLHWAIVKTV